MKTCPKCNGKYFDDDEYCSECNIKLIDNKEYNKILAELDLMSNEEREKYKYSSRYRDALKYRYGYGDLSGHSHVLASGLSSQQHTQNQKPNIPKCPTCGSTNVRPISTTKKATGFILAGIFSSNFGKSYECKDCKYKW